MALKEVLINMEAGESVPEFDPHLGTSENNRQSGRDVHSP
jgi:hypothetical protein